MVRFIVITAVVLIMASNVAGAARATRPLTPASVSNRHACGPGYDFRCNRETHQCSCVPQ